MSAAAAVADHSEIPDPRGFDEQFAVTLGQPLYHRERQRDYAVLVVVVDRRHVDAEGLEIAGIQSRKNDLCGQVPSERLRRRATWPVREGERGAGASPHRRSSREPVRPSS